MRYRTAAGPHATTSADGWSFASNRTSSFPAYALKEFRSRVAQPETRGWPMSDAGSSSDKAAPANKIFPRNLTARADYVVVGNPTNSRPEAGVDNCFPGLEFDQRNLDQRFFPGVVIYYHRADGARVIEAPLTPDQKAAGIDFGDIA